MVSQVRGNCKAFRIIRGRPGTHYLGLWINLGPCMWSNLAMKVYPVGISAAANDRGAPFTI